MRKYNRRILTALVVAYKKGIINKKPLNKWLNIKEIFYQIANYLIYLTIFIILFVIVEKDMFNYFKIDKYFYIGNYFIEKSRFISGIIMGIIVVCFYKFIKYILQIYIVKKALKKYKITDDNVEILNRVTFKINV